MLFRGRWGSSRFVCLQPVSMLIFWSLHDPCLLFWLHLLSHHKPLDVSLLHLHFRNPAPFVSVLLSVIIYTPSENQSLDLFFLGYKDLNDMAIGSHLHLLTGYENKNRPEKKMLTASSPALLPWSWRSHGFVVFGVPMSLWWLAKENSRDIKRRA